MNSWGPWKAWWLDVGKFVVTFALGAVVTITVLHDLEDERARRSFQWTKAWERDLEVAEEYRKASLLYLQAAEDALAEVSRGNDPHDSESVREWRGQANDRFLLSLEAIEIRFLAKDERVAILLAKMRNLHREVYDEYLKLGRPNTDKMGVYVWSNSMLEMSELRRLMAIALERAIDKVPS